MQRLEQSAIDAALGRLAGWKQDGDALLRDFSFRDFGEATAFLVRVALISERLNHHADYSGVYNKLRLRLSTHDAGGITQRDMNMAAEISALTA